jgi:hypothetical protein
MRGVKLALAISHTLYNVESENSPFHLSKHLSVADFVIVRREWVRDYKSGRMTSAHQCHHTRWLNVYYIRRRRCALR